MGAEDLPLAADDMHLTSDSTQLLTPTSYFPTRE